MNTSTNIRFQTADGYMTEVTRAKYISGAIETGVLPKDAHRIPEIVSLCAPEDRSTPIQFWQLYSILGPDRIVAIVGDFYKRVFDDAPWFKSVFERVGGVRHHTTTQASMWADVMGGGPYYHGAEYRLSFHHTHNAHQLMTPEGAELWVKLMVEALDASDEHMLDDPRVRASLNTFLSHFFAKYAQEFEFENRESFGETNPPWRRTVNFRTMTEDAIAALSEDDLRAGLEGRGVDVRDLSNKQDLIRRALLL